MNDRCSNCGAELFAGQQFCRRCGAPVRGAGGEAPTQIFPQGPPTASAPPAFGTSPLGADTDSVGGARHTSHQPPLASYQQTSPLADSAAHAPAAPRAPRRGRGKWLIALLVVFMLGAGVAGVAGYLWWRAQRVFVVRRAGGGVNVPGMPPAPAFPARVREAVERAGVPMPLDESGATVSGDQTVLTKTYELARGANFSVHSINGDVSVTGWDGDSAEIKITKRGGSRDERSEARVLASKTDEGLSLMTALPPGGPVSVSFEIKLPRGLRQVEIRAERAEVKVSDFGGTVVSDVKAGGVEFRGVTGVVKSKLIKGDTRVVLDGEGREGAQEFSVVKGNIEATLAEGAGADIKAETLDGDINVDDGYGLKVERAPAGRHVAGRVGEGGEPLLLKVTNGDIKLRK